MNLKKSMLCAFFMTFLMMSVVSPVVAVKPVKDDGFPAGNHAPSGAHYNLNIIGMPRTKNANFDGGEGRRIFVLRSGTTQIGVTPGPFDIVDVDGTDGRADLTLPYESGEWKVQIYVRLLGPTGSSIHILAEKSLDGSTWGLIDEFTLPKDTKFQLKTGSLLGVSLAHGLTNIGLYLVIPFLA